MTYLYIFHTRKDGELIRYGFSWSNFKPGWGLYVVIPFWVSKKWHRLWYSFEDVFGEVVSTLRIGVHYKHKAYSKKPKQLSFYWDTCLRERGQQCLRKL